MARDLNASKATDRLLRDHGHLVASLLSSVTTGSPPRLSESTPALKDIPWLRSLDRENLRTFLTEYAAAYQAALDKNSSEELDTLLKEWEATAEALTDPELRRLLDSDQLPTAKRVALDYPV